MIIKYKNSWVLWNREKSDKETIGYPKGPSSRDKKWQKKPQLQ